MKMKIYKNGKQVGEVVPKPMMKRKRPQKLYNPRMLARKSGRKA